MKERETFTHAITSSAVWGGGGKVIGILRHSVIAGAIGLSAQLDAFYAATSILAVFVFLLAGMFDVLGVPRLVELYNSGKFASFDRLARSLFTSSLIMGVISFCLIVIFRSQLTFFAVGFTDSRKELLVDGLLLIAPLALFFFPLRQLAGIHRAKAHFSIYYQAEFLVTFIWFLMIVFYRESEMILFWAWPIGVAAGFAFLAVKSSFLVRLIGNPFVPEAREVWAKAPSLALLQGLLALHITVDHFFASFLPVGALGSLSLAMVIATALTGLLRFETSYISVFGQKTNSFERDKSVNQMIGLCLYVGIPYIVTIMVLSDVIVRILFQRGVFSSVDAGQTSLVLAAYGPAVLAMISLPPIEAIYQILGKLAYVVQRAVVGLVLNIVFCYFFIFVFDFGNVGIALATTISMSGTLVFALRGLSSVEIDISWRQHARSAGVLLASSLSIALLFWYITIDTLGAAVDGGILCVYFLVLAASMLLVPVAEANAMRARLRSMLRV